MSESSATYTRWWDVIHDAGSAAEEMVGQHAEVAAPSERFALAQRARDSARWLYYLADTLELQQP